MGVAFDAVTTQTPGNPDFEHTPVGTPTLVVVTCHRKPGDLTSEITAITYGGVSLTRHFFLDTLGNTSPKQSTADCTEIWWTDAPPSGTQTVSISAAGTNDSREIYTCNTFTGSGTAPLGTVSYTYEGANDYKTVSTTNTNGETDGLMLDALTTQENEEHTPDAGQTERWDLSPGTAAFRACGSTKPGASSVTMGWDWLTNTRHTHIVVPIAPDAATGPTAGGDPTLTAAPTDVTIPLSFTASPDATGCYVHRGTTQGFTPSVGTRVTTDLGSGVTSHNNTVDEETQYYYRVEWVDAGGSTYSAELAAKSAPKRPNSVVFSGTTTSTTLVTVGRAFNSNDNTHLVHVFDDEATFIVTYLLEAGTNTVLATGLLPGVTYTFKVQAYEAAANGGTGAYSVTTDADETTITGDRTAIVTAFELETGNAARTAVVTAFEFESENAARTAVISAFELEVEVAARTAVVTAFEFESPPSGTNRAARIHAFELETGDGARAAIVTAFEFEVNPTRPDVPFQLGIPSFPESPQTYLRDNEADYRRRVEEAFTEVDRAIQELYYKVVS